MSLKSTTLGAIAVLLAGAGAAAAYPATVTTNLNVRSGPGTNYAVIDNLPAGSVVDIAGCTGNWCEVAGTGWASASYLATGRGPAYSAAPPAYVTQPAVSFYIGSDPYYWHDDGYYWYYREGRRHRINRDFFDNRRNIRWHSDRDRRRWENWRGDRGDWRRGRDDRRIDRRGMSRDERRTEREIQRRVRDARN